MRNNAFVLALLCAFLGSVTPVFAKIALEVIPPFTLVFLRFLFGTLFLLPFVLKKGELKLSSLKQLWFVGLIGALNPVLLFIALPFTQASVAPLIYACTPALTALYMFYVMGTRITQKQVIGILIGLVGVGIIILAPLAGKVSSASAFTGNALIFVAAIAFMYYGILSKKYQQHHKVSPLALTFYFSLVTVLAMVPFMLWEMGTASGGVGTLVAAIEARHLLSAIGMGVLGSGMFYLVYQYAIAAGSELAANLFTYLQPVITIGLAVLLLNETIGLPFVLGGVLAVIGARVARGS